jgi:predicted TIM-barrel fold metal-dependent hydrolase
VILDVDQHLFEPRGAWRDHIDPTFHDDALAIEDDALGWPWLTWRGQQMYPVESQRPMHPEEVGEERVLRQKGAPAPSSYEDRVPASYTDPRARLAQLDEFGVDASVLFPNFGLLFEEMLGGDLPVLCANLRAYNRWLVSTLSGHGDRLFGVGHVSLRDADWAVEEIARLGRDGIRLAMVAPSPVNGRPLADPALDRLWAAFCEAGVAPVFHVGNFAGPLDPAWHACDPEPVDRMLDSVMLWVAPAVALANMILHGTLERFPDLRIGVVELTAGWVPGFMLNLDGASDFYAARHGGPIKELPLRPSEYLLRQVRVAALAYERPSYLVQKVSDDVFMFGSDWPHAEGIAHPRADYERAIEPLSPAARDKVMGANAAWLLRL